LDLANVQSILNEPARSAPPRPHPENDGFPRRDYYRVAADLFERSMAQRLARWRRLTEVIVEGRRTLPLASPAVRDRLERYEAAFCCMADAIGRAMVQWQGVPPRRLARTGSDP
jgi:hypothetical protein